MYNYENFLKTCSQLGGKKQVTFKKFVFGAKVDLKGPTNELSNKPVSDDLINYKKNPWPNLISIY